MNDRHLPTPNLSMRVVLNHDGNISVNEEDTAIGYGWVDESKSATSGVQLIKIWWTRLNKFCKDLGFPNELRKGDYILESLSYLLGMKANNERTRKFQMWLAAEVLPAIRKTGRYETPRAKQYQPTRPLMTDDYVDAGKTIAKCDNRRLPIVLDMFHKAGLNIQLIPSIEQEQQKSKDDDLVELLNRYSLKELCEILNICKTSLYYYRAGIHKPHLKRYERIVTILKERGEAQWKTRF